MPRAAKKAKQPPPPPAPEDLDPATFRCGECAKHSVKGAVWSAKCRSCGMTIFFKTVADRSAYRNTELLYD